MAPSKAYLEFDAQPATITPYTPIEVNARTTSRPASTLATTQFGVNGTIAHTAIAGATDSAGAIRNKALLAPVGTICSLSSSFTASAIGCRVPQGPTRLGPRRTWIQPITQRSTNWKYSTNSSRGTTTMTIIVTALARANALGPHCGPR